MTVYIYSLEDPRCGSCRYVGKTVNLTHRMNMHVHDRNQHTYRARWILGLYNLKLRPIMRVLETIENSDDMDWQAREVYWIDKKTQDGCRLTNQETGGRAGKRHSVETKMRMSEAQMGKKMSDETKRKLSVAHTGKVISSETRHKLSLINTGKKASKETRAKMSVIGKGRVFSPVHLQKISDALKGRMPSALCMAKARAATTGRIQPPEERRKRGEAIKKAKALNPQIRSMECRAKISATLTGRPLSAERKAKLREAWNRPGYREKMSEIHKNRREEFEFAQRCVA